MMKRSERARQTYPAMPDWNGLARQIELCMQLKHEHGAKNIAPILARAERAMRTAIRGLDALPIDRDFAAREPDSLAGIRRLRPAGPRRMWSRFDPAAYRPRLEGAMLGRFAGCTLGAPVEFWPVERMEALARETGMEFPPRDYWTYVPEPAGLRYRMSPRCAYTRGGMDGVPVDDDIMYTLLGLLIAEDSGPEFGTGDVGQAWLKYLPHACTAEAVALKNLKKGVPAEKAGSRENVFREWIGASIRADPWGYLAPGWPERAAAMAYRDAFVSHRRNGIYGEMFFAAAIAAAFAVDDPIDAFRVGLTEIPRDCALAMAVRWALRIAPRIRDYRDAREAVDARFPGMNKVHTINNACLTVLGVAIGKTDFTRVIGETVAMGLDNDCTGATAGSLAGAIVGRRGIPRKWTRHFNNAVHSYLIGKRKFAIAGLLRRFERQAERVWAG
jgi:ADP-ribosylglycohydrolase